MQMSKKNEELKIESLSDIANLLKGSNNMISRENKNATIIANTIKPIIAIAILIPPLLKYICIIA